LKNKTYLIDAPLKARRPTYGVRQPVQAHVLFTKRDSYSRRQCIYVACKSQQPQIVCVMMNGRPWTQQRQLIMVALWNRADHYIFMLWFVLLSFFFSSPNLSRHRLDIYHTAKHGVALVRI